MAFVLLFASGAIRSAEFDARSRAASMRAWPFGAGSRMGDGDRPRHPQAPDRLPRGVRGKLVDLHLQLLDGALLLFDRFDQQRGQPRVVHALNFLRPRVAATTSGTTSATSSAITPIS